MAKVRSDKQLGSLDPALIQRLKDQLLIVMALRLVGEGGEVRMPAAEVDGTGPYIVDMEVDSKNRDFVLTLRKKH